MAPSKITLHYFDARGFGETARWLLSLSKCEWEDKRYTREEWPEFKPKTPFGQMPLIEVDGTMIAQSSAMNQYLAEEFGMFGSSNMDRANINMIIGCQQDTLTALIKAFYAKDEASKTELMKDFAETQMPKYLKFIEDKLSGVEYLVGNKLSLADVSVAAFLDSMEKRKAVDVSGYPLTAALLDRVRQLPEIRAWIEKRPQTEN